VKILLRTPMSNYTGYGNDGIGLAQALMRYGADVYLQVPHIDAPLPADVAQLLTKELKAPFDLYLNHIDPMSLTFPEEMHPHADVSVAWTMWEYSNVENMATKHRRTLRKRLKDFDALLGYSPIDRDCFAPYYKGPIAIHQGGFDPTPWPFLERDWNETNFYFCMVGVLSPRKAPFAAVQAFAELQREHEDFREHARLSLKTTSPGLHSGMEDAFPGLRVYYDVWPQNVLRDFYASQHVLLAPSRGEGKNMPALEFQSTGGAVIATNWSGHTQWLNPDYNYALDYTLEADDPYRPTTMNATVSVEDLKAKMLHVFRNRAEAKEKGEIASRIIPQAHSWDAVVDRLFLKLRAALPQDKGERLWQQAQAAQIGASRGND
jgi:glycosyltransferase involved in cell wall biosynthesis